MCSLAGNSARSEEATRALYADDRKRYAEQVASCPRMSGNYASRLAWETDGGEVETHGLRPNQAPYALRHNEKPGRSWVPGRQASACADLARA